MQGVVMNVSLVSLRELISSTISRGDLSQNPISESGADRIAALGLVDPLGAALWRVLGHHDAHSLKEAARRLHDRLRWPDGADANVRAIVCLVSVEEFLSRLCGTCGGRKEMTTSDGVKVECHECHGTGVGSMDHNTRIKRLGVSKALYAKLVPLFDKAHRALSDADSYLSDELAGKLGRDRTGRRG